jgi:hypothetical protein
MPASSFATRRTIGALRCEGHEISIITRVLVVQVATQYLTPTDTGGRFNCCYKPLIVSIAAISGYTKVTQKRSQPRQTMPGCRT